MKLPLLFLALASPAAAQTVRIEFESYPGPDGVFGTADDVPVVAPTLFAGQGEQLTDQYASLGILFTPDPAVDNMNEILDAASFSTPPSHTPLNLLASSGTLTIEAEFTVPVSRVGALIGISGGADELEIFDAAGNSLGSIVGDDEDVSLSSATPIARFVIRAASSTTPAVDNVEFDAGVGTLGTPYCGPAVPNSSGNSAEISATGSIVASDNDLTLAATGLPPMQFGIFLTSEAQAATPVASGVLCLGGSIIRFQSPGQILQADANGEYSLAIDISALPAGVPTPIMAGDTYSFTTWFRDIDPSIGNTANFSNGVEISFQ